MRLRPLLVWVLLVCVSDAAMQAAAPREGVSGDTVEFPRFQDGQNLDFGRDIARKLGGPLKEPHALQLDLALFIGAEGGHKAIVELLLQRKAGIDSRDAHGRSALHEATYGGHVEVATALLDWSSPAYLGAADKLGWTALHYAALSGGKGLAEVFLARRAAVDAVEHWGCTALHWAARRGHIPMLQLLLSHGASARLTDAEGRDAAAWARLTGHELVGAYLDNVAGIHADPPERGETAGGAAREVGLGGPKVEGLLFDACIQGEAQAVSDALMVGASIRGTDGWGSTPLHVAAHYGHMGIVSHILYAEGKEKDGNDAPKGSADREAVASPRPVLSSVADQWGRTPFLAACEGRHGNVGIAKALLDARAPLDGADMDGRTALHWAMLRGHAAVVELLVGRGANTSAVDRWGRTTVHLVSSNGHMGLLRSLLAGRARVDIVDDNLQSPVHLAAVSLAC
mmetsp:Transcript_143385/g.458330  ORF Transcript_143385/g.458330 Transcript_143385/m.458330 type:complete len:456 (+) Transcript_143385:81-1448(+)